MKVILIGGGGLAKTVIDIIDRSYPKIQILGFVDDSTINKLSNFGLELLGPTKSLKGVSQKLGCEYFINCIGNGTMKFRKEIFKKYLDKDFKFLSVIDDTSVISRYSSIGTGVIIGPNVFIGLNSIIGDNTVIYSNTVVEHDCKVDNHCFLSPSVSLSGGVKILNNSFIGTGSRIKNNISIGPSSIVGVGSVVISNVPRKATFVGNPAKKIK